VHPISPLIYGLNEVGHQAQTNQALSRIGGNRWTAYNWENNASNAGADWCYQNDSYLSPSSVPGAPVQSRLAQAEATHTALLVTVPMVDYVAADKLGGSNPPGCSGDVRKSGSGYLTTRMRRNQATSPPPLSATPNTADGNVYQDQFVYWVKQGHPNATVLFDLDNEPDLWASSHAEVHPQPATYSELMARTLTYARMVKRVWPTAEILGPVSYGWSGYTSLQGAPDASAKGDFLDWYMDQLRAAEAADGRKLVDYLDLHWYPEARGGGARITDTDANSAATVAARVQAPRSLWDPSYVETSWISQDAGVGAIRLIPRMNAKIAAHNPGTKLAIGEWNYGGGSNSAGGSHVSGAVATADALGIFGQQGVGAAAYWPLAPHEEFNLAAFAALRSYDGQRAGFGDTSQLASSSNVGVVTVYASHDAANPGRVVILAINKSTVAKTAAIKVADAQPFGHARVWRITSAQAAVVAAPALTAAATNAFRTTLPPMSVTVIVPQA
jgi:hypothetical protein